jgi:acyl transferase domain-containing protein
MTPWPHDGLRRASINSFGYGGSNAHAILDDAFNYLQSRGLEAKHCTAELPPRQLLATNGVNGVNGRNSSESSETTPSRVFVWSTSDKNGSSRISKSYSSYIRSLKDSGVNESDVLRNLSYTLAERRGRFSWRTFAVASSLDELADTIENDLPPLSRAASKPKLGYVFSGQGAQWAGMGRELFISSPVYRESILEADEFFRSLGASWSLIQEIEADTETSRINEPMVSQAACTALQVALIDLMNSWGVSPARVVGHSSGEIAAAYCIGALDKQSAWRVAYFRGVVSQKVNDASSLRGGMMAVGLGEEEVRDRIAKMATSTNLMIACVNSSSNVTISGDVKAIEALYTELEAERVFARKLNVSVAYHSQQMNEVAAEYKALLNDLHGSDAPNTGLAMFSSVSGKEVTPSALQEAEYWVQNLVSPVRFSDALYAMCTANSSSNSKSLVRLKTLNDQTKVDDIVEIGPQAALRSPVRQILGADSKLRSINYYSLLSKDKSATMSALSLAGNLFSRGQSVALENVNSSTGSAQADAKMLIGLPAYPWNHSEKYWFESRLSKDYRFRKHPRHDLLGAPVADWNPSEPRWRHFLRTAENPWIKDHKVSFRFYTTPIFMFQQLTNGRSPTASFILRPVCS